jgi:hypothetical protein
MNCNTIIETNYWLEVINTRNTIQLYSISSEMLENEVGDVTCISMRITLT